MDTVSLLGSQYAFSMCALSVSLSVLHAPKTSSCQLATDSASLPVTAGDVSLGASAADAAGKDDLVSLDVELQVCNPQKNCFLKPRLQDTTGCQTGLTTGCIV